MSYGQKNYTEKMGNGPYTIAQIGCFVTAFSNLLQKFGETADPPTLDAYFTSHNVFLADPSDGTEVKDDLAWGSITAYDPTINVVSTGANSWPTSDNAIVEFIYTENGTNVTHFCTVASYVNKTIIDSWDGVTKEPGIYGQPIRWATYAKNVPNPVPVPIPSSVQSYTVIKDVPGFMTAANAASHTNQDNTVASGQYSIFNQADGMINVTTKVTVPGSWINPADNVNTPPANLNAAYVNAVFITVQPGWGLERIASAAERPDASSPSCWQEIAVANGNPSWENFNSNLKVGQSIKVPLSGHGDGMAQTTPYKLNVDEAGLYRAVVDISVTDIQTPTNKVLLLKKGTNVRIAGEFNAGDKNYFLPLFAQTNGTWYGIPTYALLLLRNPPNPSSKKTLHDRLIIATASLVGLLKRNKKKVN